MRKVYFEDFSDFPLSEFPYDLGHSALGEYHHLMPEGYMGNWYDPINNHQFRSLDGSWMVTYSDKYYMEQNRGNVLHGHFEKVLPCLILNKKKMINYVLNVQMKLYDLKYFAGVTFTYVHSRKFLAFGLEKNRVKVFYRNQDVDKVIYENAYDVTDFHLYDLKVIVKDCHYQILLDGKNICEFYFDDISCGNVGIMALSPCAYTDFTVMMEDIDYQKYLMENEKKSMFSPLELIKKIDLKNFGTGRQIRFGHLSNGDIFMVFVQHQKRMMRDSFAHISCLTAIDLEGNILWQKGMPQNDFNNTLISADLPIQIYDMDNDGVDEVIYAQNFEVIILNAITGEEKKRMKTPLMDESYPFNRLNVDAIRVADFSNKGYKSDFIIKDRYKNVWAYDYNFNLLWHYNHKNTGHFPYIFDFNNDGCDEMYVGYDMVDSKGNILWSLPINSDHTDEIIYTSLDGKNEYLFLASGNEGFNVCTKDGEIIKSIPVGHAQRISCGHFLNDKMQICVTSFWGANGIVYLFDDRLNLLWEKELVGNGNVITPVNYDGIHELILLNGSTKYGGLMDGNGNIVVEFPNDGHPDLCAEVLDIDNDGVDEILLWNQKRMYIYKAKEYIKGNYKEKYPLYAFSNYRGEFSLKKIFKV